MFKIMGLGLVICGCTAMGVAAGNEMERRIRDLEELIRILELLEGEIGYANAVLAESFCRVAKRVRKPFSLFLEHMAEHMERLEGDTLPRIFAHHVQKDLRQTALCPEDREALIGFGEQLGYPDVKMQLAAIAHYKSQLIKACAQTQEHYRQNSKMYRYLGLMGGLFLAVIFF